MRVNLWWLFLVSFCPFLVTSSSADLRDASHLPRSNAQRCERSPSLAGADSGALCAPFVGKPSASQEPRTSLEISGDTLETCVKSSLSVPRVATAIAVWKNVICVRGGLMTAGSADFFVDGVWNRTDQLSTDRIDASAAATDSVMVFMGSGFGSPRSADFYDTRYENWTTVDDILHVPRGQANAVGFGQLAFVAGGSGYQNNTHFASAEIIDVRKRVNIGLIPFPEGVPGVASAAITKYSQKPGDDIVIFGGGSRGDTGASDAVLVFDGRTLDFVKVVYRLSAARWGLSAATIANKVFFIGGSTGKVSDVIDIFDVHKGFSRSEMHLNTPRSDAAAASLSRGYIVVAGGLGPSPTQEIRKAPAVLASVELISTNVTREHVTLNQPSFALVGASMGDRVFFAGGFYNGVMVRDAITFSDRCK